MNVLEAWDAWQSEVAHCHRLGLCMIALAGMNSPHYRRAKEAYELAQAEKERVFQAYRRAFRAAHAPDPSEPAAARVFAAYRSDGCRSIREED